jgi:hypothetical protein
VLVKTNRDKFSLKWKAKLLEHHENSNDPALILKAAMRQNEYADSEIISEVTELLWGSKNQI